MTDQTSGLTPVPIAGIPASGGLAFTALRNGITLGTHDVTFRQNRDSLTVTVRVDYAVKLGFITVFRYRLRFQETWVNGLLQSAHAETDHNGKQKFMKAHHDGNGLIVEGSQARRYLAPAGTLIASHWNMAQLDGPMVNPQDGELLTFSVIQRGAAKVADSSGKIRSAQRFALSGKESLDLWYDTDGVWTSLQAKASDGSTVSYRPVR